MVLAHQHEGTADVADMISWPLLGAELLSLAVAFTLTVAVVWYLLGASAFDGAQGSGVSELMAFALA